MILFCGFKHYENNCNIFLSYWIFTNIPFLFCKYIRNTNKYSLRYKEAKATRCINYIKYGKRCYNSLLKIKLRILNYFTIHKSSSSYKTKRPMYWMYSLKLIIFIYDKRSNRNYPTYYNITSKFTFEGLLNLFITYDYQDFYNCWLLSCLMSSISFFCNYLN